MDWRTEVSPNNILVCSDKEVVLEAKPRRLQCNMRSVISAAIIASIPIVQIGLVYKFVWAEKKEPVNKNTCRCSCFDTIFKGQYERVSRNVGYKHIYFNATRQTAVIWLVTMAFVFLAYESCKFLLRKLYRRSIRWEMLVCFLTNIYPHVYGWWGFFNYINEDFYRLFQNQVYFTITDLVSSAFILKLCDSRIPVDKESCIIILATSCNHILIGGANQFFAHFLINGAHFFQLTRDWGLFLPDMICLITSLVYLIKYSPKWRFKTMQLLQWTDRQNLNWDKIFCFAYVLFITILGFKMY